MNPKTAKTYIYIDVSNIRYACKWSSGFDLNFDRLYAYLKKKYPNVHEIRYYEGISPTDKKKQKYFKSLEQKVGYTVCSLCRQNYTMPAKYETFNCKKCGAPNTIKILKETQKLKSNVDVYMASDMLECVALNRKPLHIILFSCDGDFVEAIKSIIKVSPKSQVTVIATPKKKKNNCLSKRLTYLTRELGRANFRLVDIEVIKSYICNDPPE